MHHQVCTISPHRAILAPFLPAPTPPMVTRRCACGEPLTMEMELDVNSCVECQARVRILDRRRA